MCTTGCSLAGCSGSHFGDQGKLFIKIVNLILKTEVLGGCLIKLIHRFTFVLFKFCFDLNVPSLFDGGLFLEFLLRCSNRFGCMFYGLLIGSFKLF